MLYSADADRAAVSPSIRTEDVMKQTIRPRRPRYSCSLSFTVETEKLTADQWNNFPKSCNYMLQFVCFIHLESCLLRPVTSPNSSAAAALFTDTLCYIDLIGSSALIMHPLHNIVIALIPAIEIPP